LGGRSAARWSGGGGEPGYYASSEQSAQAMGEVAATMQQIAHGATQQSESMSKTAAMLQQVSHAIEGVSRGAQEQGVAVVESANITTQMSAAIASVAANAQTGAESAANAAQTAGNGAETIEATIEGMGIINEYRRRPSKCRKWGIVLSKLVLLWNYWQNCGSNNLWR
jgi:methyl-accepting chemotaxis protein